jgi:DNA helicase II / ATP-dependent DNA helicase PcrA
MPQPQRQPPGPGLSRIRTHVRSIHYSAPVDRSPCPSPPKWADGLNAVQRRAVDHEGGPLLIAAGAGTGKTRTLVSRLARLLDGGVAPERILLVTFSRRAAAELVRRVGHVTDPKVARRVEAGTFHSVAHRILRRYQVPLGLTDGFTVLDQADSRDLFAMIRTPVAASVRRRFPKTETVAAVYFRVVSSQVGVEETVLKSFPWCAEDIDGLREIFSEYTERKRRQRLLDFEDLLLYWRAAVTDTTLGPILAACFDHVLVDEYQDTSIVQSEILRALAGGDAAVTVVGDDAQSIYSFRSATVRNILDFPLHFPAATTVTLEQNYRSTTPILDLANAVISGSGEGMAKNLWTEGQGGALPVLATCPDQQSQAEAVCATVLEHLEAGVPLKDQAVLFRTSHHSDLVEVELGRHGIPFVKFGGLRFLESSHVRDLLSALRVLGNPWDELAWMRLLQLAEGIGPSSADRLIEALGVRSRTPVGLDPVASFCSDPSAGLVLRGSNQDLTGLADALDACRSVPEMPTGAQVELLRHAMEPMLRRHYDHPDSRLADLDALALLAFDSAGRDKFVADLTLDPPASTGDLAGKPTLDDDWLTLSTVHSAKGGEWAVVHLIHAADGAFPSDMATGDDKSIDEERRLFYVALTRARTNLHIYAPLRYHHGDPAGWSDSHSYAQRTRFLPPAVNGLLDLRAIRSAFDDLPPVAPAAVPVTCAVDTRLSDLW